MPLPWARARPQDHPEPLEGVRAPLAAQGGRGPGQEEEGSREGTACPPLSGQALLGLHTGQAATLPEWTFLLPAPGGRLPLSSWGCTKWPLQPSAILCMRQAGERVARQGRREGDHCPPACPEWPGRSPAPAPAPARPWPRLPWAWHQRTSWQGRPGTPALHPAGRPPRRPPDFPDEQTEMLRSRAQKSYN